MSVSIVGAGTAVRRLAAQARAAGVEPTSIAELGEAPVGAGGLADRLRELERRLGAGPAGPVVLADDTDAALAGVLVATKLGRVAVAGSAASSTSPNGRLIAQLADERLDPGAAAFADWLRSYTQPR